MLITLSAVIALLCGVGAIICYVSIRDIHFKSSGKAYAVDIDGEYLYTVKHGRLKVVAGAFFTIVCICGMLGSSGFFLREMGLPIFTIEKLGGLIGCLVGGSFLYRRARWRPVIVQPGLTLAEVVRQGMLSLGLLGQGAAWLMLYWIALDYNSWLAFAVGIGGLIWAFSKMRRRYQ